MAHGEKGKVGVLLCQIGTPDAPTAKALRVYLRKFLSDPRVIDLNPLLWKPILHGIVLRTRPRKSAEMYKEIWTPGGSPLRVESQKVLGGVQERLGEWFVVELGMAYGNPSIPDAVAALEQQGIRHLVVLPLFPQFSTGTTASVFDEAYAAVSGRSWDKRKIRKKLIPSLTFAGPYYDNPAYISALAHRVRTALQDLPYTPDKYILTFHGLPKRYIEEGDPYKEHCDITSSLLAQEMGWTQNQWVQAFQSRFGAEEWLTPYADTVLKELHGQGIERPCIIPLSFVTDCLETLHELGILGREAFAQGGGKAEQFTLIPCLNDDEAWLDTLADIARANT